MCGCVRVHISIVLLSKDIALWKPSSLPVSFFFQTQIVAFVSQKHKKPKEQDQKNDDLLGQDCSATV